MPPAKYDERQWEALEAILALLPSGGGAAEGGVRRARRGRLHRVRARRGAGARRAPTTRPTCCSRSTTAITHILVDEFQDTSLSQWELLSAADLGLGAPATAARLFLVGDPMQSIYRFREAEVALFLRARRAGHRQRCSLEPLTLSHQLPLAAGPGRLGQRRLRAHPAGGGGRGSRARCRTRRPSRDHPALAGPAASWHVLLRPRGGSAPRGRSSCATRKTAPRSWCATATHLDEIVPALKAAGIRFRAVEIEQLGERQVVQDLYALTRALSHLADRIAWLAVLRAPWCGLTLHDLSLRSPRGADRALAWDLLRADLSANGRKRAERVRGRTRVRRIADRGRGSLRDRVEGAWLALGGPACVESATDLEDAEIYPRRAREPGGGGRARRSRRARTRRCASSTRCPTSRRPTTTLQIMTIHKAKGLEFDTVIVPGLDRGPRAAPTRRSSCGRERCRQACCSRRSRKPAPTTTRLPLPAQPRGRGRGPRGGAPALRRRHARRRAAAPSRVHEVRRRPASSKEPRAALAARARLAGGRGALARMVPEQLAMDSMHAPRAPITDAHALGSTVERVAPPPERARGRRRPKARAGRGDRVLVGRRDRAPRRHRGAPLAAAHRGGRAARLGREAHRLPGPALPPRSPKARRIAGRPRAAPRKSWRALWSNALSDERGRWLLGPHPEARNEYRLRGLVQGRIAHATSSIASSATPTASDGSSTTRRAATKARTSKAFSTASATATRRSFAPMRLCETVAGRGCTSRCSADGGR